MPRDAESFLGAVLSRGGSLALPYDGQVKRLVRLHLLELIKDLPSLSVRLRSYTHLDGSDVQLLMADGTVPMFYQSAKYNIPVAIWLPEGYPVQPPIAYVVPTSDMIITPQHPYVDGSGLVTSPYLERWQYPDSNLRELAQVVAAPAAPAPACPPAPATAHLPACLSSWGAVPQADTRAASCVHAGHVNALCGQSASVCKARWLVGTRRAACAEGSSAAPPQLAAPVRCDQQASAGRRRQPWGRRQRARPQPHDTKT